MNCKCNGKFTYLDIDFGHLTGFQFFNRWTVVSEGHNIPVIALIRQSFHLQWICWLWMLCSMHQWEGWMSYRHVLELLIGVIDVGMGVELGVVHGQEPAIVKSSIGNAIFWVTHFVGTSKPEIKIYNNPLCETSCARLRIFRDLADLLVSNPLSCLLSIYLEFTYVCHPSNPRASDPCMEDAKSLPHLNFMFAPMKSLLSCFACKRQSKKEKEKTNIELYKNFVPGRHFTPLSIKKANFEHSSLKCFEIHYLSVHLYDTNCVLSTSFMPEQGTIWPTKLIYNY